MRASRHRIVRYSDDQLEHHALTTAADLVGVEVPANLLFFGASMLLLGVSIHQSYEMGRLEERTRTLAEEIGLLRLEIELSRATTVTEDPEGRRDPS